MRWPIIFYAVAALAAAALIACKETGSTTASPPPPPPARRDAAPAAPAAPGLDEGAARALLDRWRAAQNRGDFEAYAALYAADFVGVRRSGRKAVHLDRAGWLRDRKRMFESSPSVLAGQVRITREGGAVLAEFEQTWISDDYTDTGPKRMRLVLEGGQPRIAREEMLASHIETDEVDKTFDPPDEDDIDEMESKDVGRVDGSFTGKGRTETAILRVYTGETRPPHGEKSGEQGFLETERSASLVIDRDGREVVVPDHVASWTDGWEWDSKLQLVGRFRLGPTGIDAVVIRRVDTGEGDEDGISSNLSVVRVDSGHLVTLWEASAGGADAAIEDGAIDVSLSDRPDDPMTPTDESEAGARSLRLVWRGGKLVELKR